MACKDGRSVISLQLINHRTYYLFYKTEWIYFSTLGIRIYLKIFKSDIKPCRYNDRAFIWLIQNGSARWISLFTQKVTLCLEAIVNPSHLSSVIARKRKMSRKNAFSNFFSLVCGQLKSRKWKKSCEPFWRKTDFKFPTYLMKAKNWSKSLKEVCERGVALTNDTNNFSSPYPL